MEPRSRVRAATRIRYSRHNHSHWPDLKPHTYCKETGFSHLLLLCQLKSHRTLADLEFPDRQYGPTTCQQSKSLAENRIIPNDIVDFGTRVACGTAKHQQNIFTLVRCIQIPDVTVREMVAKVPVLKEKRGARDVSKGVANVAGP